MFLGFVSCHTQKNLLRIGLNPSMVWVVTTIFVFLFLLNQIFSSAITLDTECLKNCVMRREYDDHRVVESCCGTLKTIIPCLICGLYFSGKMSYRKTHTHTFLFVMKIRNSTEFGYDQFYVYLLSIQKYIKLAKLVTHIFIDW